MRKSRSRILVAGLLKLVLVCGFSVTAWAQGASPPGPQATPPSAVAQAPAAPDAGATEVAIGHIVSEFPLVRLLSYVALTVGVVCGLGIYVWRRRGFRRFAITTGVVVTLLVAGLCFALFSSLVLSADSAACATMSLKTGTQRERYDDACRESREKAANAFGIVGLFRSHGMSAGDDLTVAVADGVVKTLAWLSLLGFALGLFLLLRPLALKLFVRK